MSAVKLVIDGPEVLWRVARGSKMVVHLADCRYLALAKSKWVWNWADGREMWEAFADPTAPWNIACKKCLATPEALIAHTRIEDVP
jgi:hypothetical protein